MEILASGRTSEAMPQAYRTIEQIVEVKIEQDEAVRELEQLTGY